MDKPSYLFCYDNSISNPPYVGIGIHITHKIEQYYVENKQINFSLV